MKVLCKECKYFNKRNICSALGKERDAMSIAINKAYIHVVNEQAKCPYYKRKWWKFWINNKGER